MKNNLDQTMQRARQYWYVDGLNEIFFGVLCLLLGIYFYLENILPQENLLRTFLEGSFVLLIVGSAFLVNKLVGAVKARLTYPRTGYVSYPYKSGKYRWLTALIAILIGGLIAWLLARAPVSFAWMPVFSGLVFSAVWLYLAYRIGLVRFYLLSAAALLIGLGLSLARIDNIPGLAAFYTLVSLAMFISGGVTLRTYLRQTQPL